RSNETDAKSIEAREDGWRRTVPRSRLLDVQPAPKRGGSERQTDGERDGSDSRHVAVWWGENQYERRRGSAKYSTPVARPATAAGSALGGGRTSMDRQTNMTPYVIAVLGLFLGSTSRVSIARAQSRQEPGHSIGTVTTQGNLIVMTLNQGALGKAN